MNVVRANIRGIILIACIASPSLAASQADATATTQPHRQQPQRVTRTITKTIDVNYLLYLPPEYAQQHAKKWPLLLFLHGAGERGDDLEQVKLHGPPKYIAAGKDYPFVIVSPQCPTDAWWDVDVLVGLLDAVIESNRIDPDRIYVTGLSMGGFATWHLAARQPERFAAIAPVCGGGNVADAPRLNRVPIWAFHGAKDRLVPAQKSREMIDAVKQAGGNTKLTVYPDAGHDSWTETYTNPELYSWFLSHHRDSESR